MSTQEIMSQVESLSLAEKMSLLEALVQSLKAEAPVSEKIKAEEEAHREEIRRRRREFKIKAFHLGGDVHVDREELYAERGL